MTGTVHDLDPKIDATDLGLPEHKFAEKFGPAIVLLLIAALGLLLLGYEPLGWFVFGALVFAVVVTLGLRRAQRDGRN